jgi:hypothetical protein
VQYASKLKKETKKHTLRIKKNATCDSLSMKLNRLTKKRLIGSRLHSNIQLQIKFCVKQSFCNPPFPFFTSFVRLSPVYLYVNSYFSEFSTLINLTSFEKSFEQIKGKKVLALELELVRRFPITNSYDCVSWHLKIEIYFAVKG